MNTAKLSWLALPMVFLLTGCPSGDGGGTFNEGTIVPPVAYVANSGSDNVSAYLIGTGTGVLTPVAGSPFAAGTNPSAVAVSPNGAFAFVANLSSNNVSAYTINSATGVLTPVAGSPFADGGAVPSAMTVSPNGAFLFVANGGSNDVSVYSIAAGTGVLTPVAGSPFLAGTNPGGVAVSPNGTLALVVNRATNTVSVYSIAAGTGVLTPVAGSPFPTGANPSAIAVAPSGSFAYVVNRGSDTITAFAVDATTGALTALGAGLGNPFATGTTPTGITITPNGSFLYVSNSVSNNVSAYALNSSTGVLTPLDAGIGNPFAAGTTPVGVTVTPDDAFVYVANSGTGNVSAYTVDSGTGALTALLAGTGNPFAAGTSPSGIATPGRP